MGSGNLPPASKASLAVLERLNCEAKVGGDTHGGHAQKWRWAVVGMVAGGPLNSQGFLL